MDPKFIIVHSDGGLCNKLFSVIDGMYLARKTDRKIMVIWNSSYGCNCPFQNIFDNDIVVVNTSNMQSISVEYDTTAEESFLEDLKYGSDSNIKFLELFGLNADDYSADYNKKLKQLLNDFDNVKCYHHHDNADNADNLVAMRKGKCGDKNWLEYSVNLDDFKAEEELIIKFSDTLLSPYMTLFDAKEIVKTLKLKKNIQDKIDNLTATIGLNKDVLGIHERRTDFLRNKTDSENKNIVLRRKINDIISNNPSQKIFLASDDINIREDFARIFPTNVIIYKQSAEPIFKDSTSYHSGCYELCDNAKMERSGEFVINGVIDLYLLGRTTFKEEYNLTCDYYCHKFPSTYSLMAKVLSLI